MNSHALISIAVAALSATLFAHPAQAQTAPRKTPSSSQVRKVVPAAAPSISFLGQAANNSGPTPQTTVPAATTAQTALFTQPPSQAAVSPANGGAIPPAPVAPPQPSQPTFESPPPVPPAAAAPTPATAAPAASRPTAPAPSTGEDGGSQDQQSKQSRDQRHLGFTLRVSVGPSNFAVRFPDSGLSLEGRGTDARFSIGANLVENLQLNVESSASLTSSPTASQGTQSVTWSGGKVERASVGLGLTYFIMPVNIYFGGSVSACRLALTDESAQPSKISTPIGQAYRVVLGKDWWVGPGAGLGAQLFWESFTTPQGADPSNSEVIVNRTEGSVYGAALSLAYH